MRIPVRLAAAGLGPEPFRLGLIHSPSRWTQARQADARILGLHTGGLYEEGDAKLYVSRGLGVVGLPLRVALPSELLVPTLVRGRGAIPKDGPV